MIDSTRKEALFVNHVMDKFQLHVVSFSDGLQYCEMMSWTYDDRILKRHKHELNCCYALHLPFSKDIRLRK